ncbi:hypothetical protein SK128_023225, partial [Halocaridina rubra]
WMRCGMARGYLVRGLSKINLLFLNTMFNLPKLFSNSDIEDTSYEQPNAVLGFGVSPKDKKYMKYAEDVIFGQGILSSSLGGRPKFHQRKTKVRLQSAYGTPTRYRNINETSDDGNNVSEMQNVDPLLSDDQKTPGSKFSSDTIPGRYVNAVDEARYAKYSSSIHASTKITSRKDLQKDEILRKRSPMWMRVTDNIHTYSAFWDARKELVDGPVVRILGIVKYNKGLLHADAAFKWNGNIREEMLNCSCLLWYRAKAEPHVGKLKGFIFEEGRELFAGIFFLCYPRIKEDLRDNSTGPSTLDSVREELVPYAVSLSPNNTVNAPHKLIYVTDTSEREDHVKRNNSSAVCVRALFGPYSDVRGMVQFIAYYSTVMKVSHFYFYDLAIGHDVYKLLNILKAADLTIDILSWNLPTSEWGELWDIGALTAMNDCVYRSTGKHSHVALVDLDEFIVPRTSVSGFGELYQKILQFRRGQYGDAALIPCAFYCFDFKAALFETHRNHSFPIFDFVHREARLWPMKSRSKMVVAPESIVSVGHHMVHNFVRKSLENRGSPKLISVLHHYRRCESLRLGVYATGGKVLDEDTIKDTSMMKYKRAVMQSKVMLLYREQFSENR